MRTNCILYLSLSLTAAWLVGCGPSEPDPWAGIPEQASFCAADFDEDFPETRQVDLGFGPAEAFQPYRDGDDVDTMVGGQGATMITPMVRVAKGPGDGPEPCFRVRVAEEGPDGFASVWNIQFEEVGDKLFSDGVLYFITSTRGDVTLTVTVQGEGFSGTKSVDVTFR